MLLLLFFLLLLLLPLQCPAFTEFIFLSIIVLVRKGKDNKAEIVIIDHGLYETLQQR